MKHLRQSWVSQVPVNRSSRPPADALGLWYEGMTGQEIASSSRGVAAEMLAGALDPKRKRVDQAAEGPSEDRHEPPEEWTDPT